MSLTTLHCTQIPASPACFFLLTKSLFTVTHIANAVGAEQPVVPGSIEAQPTGDLPLPPTPSLRESLRGYMRDVSPSDGKIVVHTVGYGEYIEDPKVNEPDASDLLSNVKTHHARPYLSAMVSAFHLWASIGQ